MPDLYIITGANGAGKSTVGYSYLPEIVQENQIVFDGDKLAMEKRMELHKIVTPSLKEARRMADEWLLIYFESLVKASLKNSTDFVYEGHLPNDGNWKTPARFKRAGYNVHVVLFGLKDTKVSEVRVFERAKYGGHNVPLYDIENNYYGNLFQVNKRFKTIHELKIVDTTITANPKVLAVLKNGEIVEALHHGKLPEWFELHLPKIYRKIETRDNRDPFKKLTGKL
jgi:predicted ABC-type ATPase